MTEQIPTRKSHESGINLDGPSREELQRQVLEAVGKNKSLTMIKRLRNENIQAQLRRVSEEHPGVFSVSPDKVMEKLNAALNREESVTHILRSMKTGRSMTIPFLRRAFIGIKHDKKFATNQAKEYVEAHEKGHAIRQDLFIQGTFFENLTLSKRMSRGFSRWQKAKEQAWRIFVCASFAAQLAIHVDGVAALGLLARPFLTSPYLFSAAEIYERMSQLKNYFGIEDDTPFTSAHLAYAREHYIRDTEVDNNMKQFFKAITPEREEEFLKIMNSFGV